MENMEVIMQAKKMSGHWAPAMAANWKGAVVVNAFIPPFGGMDGYGTTVFPVTVSLVKEAIASGAKTFIGHPATAKLLGVEPSRGEAAPEIGEFLADNRDGSNVAFVVRLARRQAVSGQEQEVTEADLQCWKVAYGPVPCPYGHKCGCN